MDKYLTHLRKQKHLKIETVKANMANRTKSSNDKQSRPSARSEKQAAGSRLKMASKMSNKPGNLSQIDENKEKENEEGPESMQCKFLLNIKIFFLFFYIKINET